MFDEIWLAVAIFVAIIGALIGAIVYANAKDKYENAGVWGIAAFASAIILSFIGIIICVIAYFVARKPIKKRGKRNE